MVGTKEIFRDAILKKEKDLMEVEREQQEIREIARLGSIKDVFAEEAANASPTVTPKISRESSKLKL